MVCCGRTTKNRRCGFREPAAIIRDSRNQWKRVVRCANECSWNTTIVPNSWRPHERAPLLAELATSATTLKPSPYGWAFLFCGIILAPNSELKEAAPMSQKKYGQGHTNQPKNPHPASSPHEKKDYPECVKNKAAIEQPPAEKKLRGMSVFEWIMAVLTFFGLVIAGLTGGIFWNQLNEMQADQRAWMNLSAGKVGFGKDQSGQTTVVVPVTVSNTGKTPARHFFSNIVVEKIPNGQSPHFLYENVPRLTDSTGMFRPNTQISLEAALVELDPKDAARQNTRYRVLSEPERQELLEGKTYIAIYAYSSYDDIFGKHHWDKYCVFAALSPTPVAVTARACTDYNDTDNN